MFEALAPLREAFPAARWVAPHKLHLTLVFLGPTDPARVAHLTRAMGAAGAHQQFDVATGEGGGRANQWRGGVAWLRLGPGASRVARLALDLDAALGSATYDESHMPRPHLTVARGVSPEVLAAIREWSAANPPLRWHVDRLVLFRSHTDSRGSRYEELATADLIARRSNVTDDMRLTGARRAPRLRNQSNTGVDRE